MGNAQGGDRSPSFGSKRDQYPYRPSPLATGMWHSADDDSMFSQMNSNLYTDSGGLQIRLSCDDYSTGQRTPNVIKFDGVQEFPVVLKYTGNAKAVSVTGSWDGWKKKIRMVKSTDDFTTIINLPEGRHEFRFVVDGRPICDNNFPRSADNNLILVDKGDFEVFDALERDSQDVAASRSSGGGSETGAAAVAGGSGRHRSTHHQRDATPSSATAAAAPTPRRTLAAAAAPNTSSVSDASDNESSGNEALSNDTSQFSQITPLRRAFDKSNPPPALPPHLLQVILNKDTPVSCDPNVLPEPNHVMLNHLYALSIKDDVMVLSATHRYRKKYVTTLLYKPI